MSIGLCKSNISLCKASRHFTKKKQNCVKVIWYDTLEGTEAVQGKDAFWWFMNWVIHSWMPKQGWVLLKQSCVYGLLKKAFPFLLQCIFIYQPVTTAYLHLHSRKAWNISHDKLVSLILKKMLVNESTVICGSATVYGKRNR